MWSHLSTAPATPAKVLHEPSYGKESRGYGLVTPTSSAAVMPI